MPTQLLHRGERLFGESVQSQPVAVSCGQGQLVEVIHNLQCGLSGTNSSVAPTIETVTCNQFRELVSARIDDELLPAEDSELDAHLAHCSSCHAYQEDTFALRRSMRIAATPVEHPEPPKIKALPSIATASALQWALFVIGGTLVALNAQAVLFAESGAETHIGRHDGVFGTALGVAMLAVAIKPQRAIGLVPLTSAITVLMAAVALSDLIASRASVWTEALHLVEFGGLVCLWVISGGPSRLQRRTDLLHRHARSSTVPSWPTS